MGTPESVFNAIYIQHKDKVYRQAWRMTRSSYLAEETVQEVFLRLWKQADKLPEIQQIESWIHIVTKHFVFDYMYYTARRKSLTLHLPLKIPRVDADDAQLEARCKKFLALAESFLSPRQKQAYQLRYYKGLQKQEVARIMKISPFTAGHHIKGAMAVIRREVYKAVAG